MRILSMAENLIKIFEESAQEYDAWFDRHRHVYESEILALKSFMGPGGIGLEIGVGTGRFAVPLEIAVGVEPTAAMAVMAQRRGIHVYRAVAEALPFRRASFDLVMMVTVLCFLRDPFLSLTEATRVLKPEGRILIGMIDRHSPLGRSYEAHKPESKFYRQANFYTIGRALEWLARLNYRKVEICQTLFGQLSDITQPEPVRTGHGDGGFVVITAQKHKTD
jgi:ubiquinone/menaquinone biosynthesis C-methylase UbiE